MSDGRVQDGPEWNGVDGLIGLAAEGAEVIDGFCDWDWNWASLWVVETAVARIVVDHKARRVTSYPTSGLPRGIHDRRSRPWTHGDPPPTPGENWSWTETVEAGRTDPWGDRVEHPVGLVISVRGVDL